jgi:hypothetical protein
MTPHPVQIYNSIDLNLLYEFISRGQEEHLHLDFKQAAASMRTEDRKNLAKAISGFANADGGVIVWGIDASPNADQIDCAKATVPIAPLALFMSQLAEFTGAAVNPIVDGVIHRAVEESPNKGYAVTLVPASDLGPHMAKLGEDRYYKRSGSRFAKMEHFDLEDMFGRRQRPVLKLAYRVGHAPGTDISKCVDVLLSIENIGRGTAKAPYLEVVPPPPHSATTFGLSSAVPERALVRVVTDSSRGPRHYFGTANFVIHPATKFDIAGVRVCLDNNGALPHNLTIHCNVAAENFRLTALTINVPRSELLKAFKERRART